MTMSTRCRNDVRAALSWRVRLVLFQALKLVSEETAERTHVAEPDATPAFTTTHRPL